MKNKTRHAEIMDVTPKLAAEWLVKNTQNRPLRQSLAETYAETMRRGEWKLTAEPVVFSDTDKLMDGQHRLAGIVSSGITVPMTVWFNCDEVEFNVLGQGRRRTIGDILSLTKTGLADPFVTASAVSAFARHALAYGGPGEPWLAQKLLTRFPTDFTWACKYKHKLHRLATREVMAGLILSRLVAAKITDELVEQLQSGIGFDENDPGRLLFRYLHENLLRLEQRDSPETVFYKVCNALANKVQKKPAEALMQTPNGLHYLRNTAKDKIEPALKEIYGDKIPNNFWAPRVSSNRKRLIRNPDRHKKGGR